MLCLFFPLSNFFSLYIIKEKIVQCCFGSRNKTGTGVKEFLHFLCLAY